MRASSPRAREPLFPSGGNNRSFEQLVLCSLHCFVTARPRPPTFLVLETAGRTNLGQIHTCGYQLPFPLARELISHTSPARRLTGRSSCSLPTRFGPGSVNKSIARSNATSLSSTASLYHSPWPPSTPFLRLALHLSFASLTGLSTAITNEIEYERFYWTGQVLSSG